MKNNDSKYYKWKETQGHKKMKRRLHELFSNEVFNKELNRIEKIKDSTKQNMAYWNLAEKYSLAYKMGEPFLEYIIDKDTTSIDKNLYLDVCIVRDDVDEYLNEVFEFDYNTPPSQRPDQRAEILAYPIRIGINPKATKRDVLDFISKRWEYIRDKLDLYEEDPTIIKSRPKEERDKFIWENRHLKSVEIADKTNKKFPEENLTYSDINKILSKLKKRKKSDLV